MSDRINEELRQYKLYKIQEKEDKIRRFKNAHKSIKEHIVIKFSKNSTSNILGAFCFAGAIAFLLLGMLCLSPGYIIQLMIENGEKLSLRDKQDMTEVLSLLKYFFFGISALSGSVTYLLKLNNKKRNNNYLLSGLLEEVMDYMENSSFEEKRKYEYFVDSLAEKDEMDKKTNVDSLF